MGVPYGTQELMLIKSPTESPINGFEFSPFIDTLVATGQEDGSVTFFDIPSKKPIHRFKEHVLGARSLCFSPISKLLLISVGSDRQIVFYDVVGKTKVQSIKCPESIR